MTAAALRRRGRIAAAAILGAAGLAACGSSGAGHPAHRASSTSTADSGVSAGGHGAKLAVSPALARPGSTVHFTFTAPVASGVRGATRTAYTLSVTGAARGGCVGVHEASAPSVQAHARATITVGPAQLGQDWCTGRYTARVLELASAACRRSQPCPQYIRVVATVASGGFRVRGG